MFLLPLLLAEAGNVWMFREFLPPKTRLAESRWCVFTPSPNASLVSPILHQTFEHNVFSLQKDDEERAREHASPSSCSFSPPLMPHNMTCDHWFSLWKMKKVLKFAARFSFHKFFTFFNNKTPAFARLRMRKCEIYGALFFDNALRWWIFIHPPSARLLNIARILAGEGVMTLFMIDNSDGSESIERRPEGLSVRGMIGSHKAVSLNFFYDFRRDNLAEKPLSAAGRETSIHQSLHVWFGVRNRHSRRTMVSPLSHTFAKPAALSLSLSSVGATDDNQNLLIKEGRRLRWAIELRSHAARMPHDGVANGKKKAAEIS